ncbi:MAG: hypothetical protein F6K58_20935 [Symploca sp. SIO2E9]|nr:hypothetical protein [Symploca sp. SIO2E9]
MSDYLVCLTIKLTPASLLSMARPIVGFPIKDAETRRHGDAVTNWMGI